MEINDAELIAELLKIIQSIKYALNTEENGEALVQVARNAHQAEMELASWEVKFDREGSSLTKALEHARRAFG